MSTLWGNPVHFENVDARQRITNRIDARRRRRSAAKAVYLVARLLLGFLFGVLGLNGFLHFLPNPPYIPPAAATFAATMATTHFSYFVFGVQVICGFLVLFNRYVPLAIVTLAAVIANILAFHITMWPSALIPMPIIATVLWFIVAWSIRPAFAPLLAQKVEAV